MKAVMIATLLYATMIAGEVMSIYDIEVTNIKGENIALKTYENRVMLIVNVASKCGFTGQYEGLQALHEAYSQKGLSILGFPCNQFMSQEPDDNEAIQKFCTTNFGVSFDMFAKIDVNGKNAHPLYVYLKKQSGGMFGSAIKWNFTKFLVDKEGKVVKRYAPATTPKEIEADIKALL